MGGNSQNKMQQIVAAIKDSVDTTGWTSTKGNSLELEYYVGVVIGNPSGNKNIKRIKYKKDGSTVLYKELTYDALDDILTVITY